MTRSIDSRTPGNTVDRHSKWRELSRNVAATLLCTGLANATAFAQTTVVGGGLDVVAPAFFAASVSNLDHSEAWYRRILNVERRREVASRDGRGRARILASGHLTIELIEYADSRSVTDVLEPGAHALQLHHIFKTGIFVRNATAAHEYLTAMDVSLDASVSVDGELRMKTFVFRDPDGNRIQVFERCDDSCAGGRDRH